MTKREKIEAMLQDRPNEVFLHYSLAMEHLSEQPEPPDEDAALSSFEAARRLDPDYVPVYLMLGMLHSRRDENDAAREVLEAGIPIAAAVNNDHAISEMQAVLEALPED